MQSHDYAQKLEFTNVNEMVYDGNLDLIKAVVKDMWSAPKRGLDLFLRCDVAPRSGLGASASAFVAMIGLLNHLRYDKRITDYEIAEKAYNLETFELKNLVGRQDQYAAVFGGLNFIEFKGDEFIRVNQLRLEDRIMYELEKNLILVHVGERPASGDILQDHVDGYKKKDEKVVDALKRTKELAFETKSALLRGDLMYFGQLLHESWSEKKRYSPHVTNDRIDELYELARKHGALGGKVSGAGGGGHMILYCKPNTEQIVAEELRKAGAKPVDFSFDFKGLQTWEIDE